jgi:hypothetical protein
MVNNTKRNKSLYRLSLLSALVASGAVDANQTFSPAAIPLDNGINITPTISVALKNDDNITFQTEDEIASLVTVINPAVSAVLDDGVNVYSFNYSGVSGTYADSEDDNYFDHDVALSANLGLSAYTALDLAAGYTGGHEPRGTGNSEGNADAISEPTLYSNMSLSANYSYGLKESNGRIELSGLINDKAYDESLSVTNGVITDLTEGKDFTSSKLGGAFYFQTGAGGELFIEVSDSLIRYEDSGSSRDSDDARALVGIKWEATALTSGSFKVGIQNKAFESDTRDDFSGLAWEGNIQYQPFTFSTFTLTTSSAAKDPSVVGDYIEDAVYSASWMYNFSDAVDASLSYSLNTEDYVGESADGRADETSMFSANLDYAFRSNVLVTGSLSNMERTSTTAGIGFTQNVVGINVTVGM